MVLDGGCVFVESLLKPRAAWITSCNAPDHWRGRFELIIGGELKKAEVEGERKS